MTDAGAADGLRSSRNSTPPIRPETIVARNQSRPMATAASVGTPEGLSISARPPSRTPTPLMLTGTTIASATSGTTANHTDSGSDTPSAWAINATATEPPIWTSMLQPTACVMRLGRNLYGSNWAMKCRAACCVGIMARRRSREPTTTQNISSTAASNTAPKASVAGVLRPRSLAVRAVPASTPSAANPVSRSARTVQPASSRLGVESASR